MNNNELTPEEKARWETLAEMPDDQIDTSDIPEIINWSAPKKRGIFQLPPDERREAILELKRTHPRVADTSERGLESYIVAMLTGMYGSASDSEHKVRERPASYAAGWTLGYAADYDAQRCVDLKQLVAFLTATQPGLSGSLSLDADTAARRDFLNRLRSELAKRGVIDVLRRGIEHLFNPHITLFYPPGSSHNAEAQALYRQNRFSVSRQVHYSTHQKGLSLDLVLFVNGLPIATFELKNSLTKQTVADAVQQYRRTRNPREELFREGRCAAHFAVDDNEVRFSTKLAGDASVFLPFNKGFDDGAGNPVNPNGLRTDYLWTEVLAPDSLTDIIRNYSQMVDGSQIWPRYHQLDVVRNLLAHAQEHGAEQK